MILVTGADGYIGQRVCHYLAAAQHEIIAIDLEFTASDSSSSIRRAGDICDRTFLSELLQSFPIDKIVHLAAIRATALRKNPAEAVRVNIDASLTLLELAAQTQVERFIFGSSISTDGNKPVVTYGAVSEQEPAAAPTITRLIWKCEQR